MTFPQWAASRGRDLTDLTPEQLATLQAEWREWIQSQESPDRLSELAVPDPSHFVGGPDGAPPLWC